MKKISFGILILGLTIASSSCESNDNTDAKNSTVDALATKQELAHGFELLSTKCFACHGPDASMADRMGPPMIAIKKHYIDENTTLADFTSAVSNFVANPSDSISNMPGAVRRFGLMPKMNFEEAEIRIIAKYLFENEIEEPEWFQKHQEEQQGKKGSGQGKKGFGNNMPLTLKEKGQKLALSTKKILGKNLMGAINSKGSTYAVDFCKIKANHLIDSMAAELNAKITRVTDQPRNASAMANKRELSIITSFKTALASGEEIVSVLDETDNTAIGYYPITTNQMCLQCHGSKKDQIDKQTLAKINQLYPKDKATGYDINQLRGVWVVEMTK